LNLFAASNGKVQNPLLLTSSYKGRRNFLFRLNKVLQEANV